MKFLIIGLGSMGKRRIRNLLSLRVQAENIYVMDKSLERVALAQENYGVQAPDQVPSDHTYKVFICTPPLQHAIALESVQNLKIDSVFIEAGLNPEVEYSIFEYCRDNKIYLYFSMTMRFFPFVLEILDLLNKNEIGKIVHVQYSSGQNLNDWHPYEKIADYYVTELRSSATREIVNFELTWLLFLFGMPNSRMEVMYNFKNTIYSGIADAYSLLFTTEKDIAISVHIDIVAPTALRSLQIQGTEGQITWSNMDGLRINFQNREFESKYESSEVSLKYDVPYMKEVSAFLSKKYTISDSIQYLKILCDVESALPSPLHHKIQEEVE